MQIEYINTEDLVPYINNPKEHPASQVKKIASSIREFGFRVPLLVRSDYEVVAGHGRILAVENHLIGQLGDLLKELEEGTQRFNTLSHINEGEVPCIVSDDMTKEQAQAFRIADNKVAESGWDLELLEIELEELQAEDYDIEDLGFEEEELVNILDEDKKIDENLEPEGLPEDIKDWKILNLYAGIGGNRKFWPDECEITAIEYNQEIADAYQEFFPDDEVIVTDAHSYLEEHFDEYDFIWSSPPCPTHSRMRKYFGNNKPIYPDLNLYEEILFLQGYFEGKWVIENVKSWYDPLIEPQEIGRHYYWSNFKLEDIFHPEKGEIDSIDRFDTDKESLKKHVKNFRITEREFEYIPNLSDYPRDKIIRNMVHPKTGEEILREAFKQKDKKYENKINEG